MLKVKDWLDNKKSGVQFDVLEVTQRGEPTKVMRIKDSEIFELGTSLGIAAFTNKHIRFLQNSYISGFSADRINVNIRFEIEEYDVIKARENPDYVKIIVSVNYLCLEINQLTTKKLSELYSNFEKDFKIKFCLLDS